MMLPRKIKLRGCNCKACRSHWYGHHYHQNKMRKLYRHLLNKRMRQYAKEEIRSFGEVPMKDIQGWYYD